MKHLQNNSILLGVLWLVLVLFSFFNRSYIPIDETRYITVAWNMFLDHDYLVPHLNGEPYSHKPPLLFWLINLGWSLFGVNDWWPRLLPSLFSLSVILLTQKIAARLWPERPQIAHIAALVLISSGLWAVFTSALMFDMLVAFFTALGALGLLLARQDNDKKGWGLLIIAFAGGLLAKGPAIFLQVLPLALLAPWWIKGQTDAKTLRKWYFAVLASVVVGAILLLMWAIPAGISGGPKYQHAIFWGQTADRMVDSFAHQRPVYWYFPILFIILFPWLFALPVWRALARTRNEIHEAGIRFCWAWLLPPFVFFSFISGKQPHYLLPIIPAIALLIGRGWDGIEKINLIDKSLIALIFSGLGAALLWALNQPDISAMYWIKNASPFNGVLLIAISVGFIIFVGHNKSRYIGALAAMGLTLVLIIYVGIIRAAGPVFDVSGISQKIKTLQNQHIPLVNIGKYHGQYNFVGRLNESPDTLVSESLLPAWFEKHPNGRAIIYINKKTPQEGLSLEFEQPYLGVRVGVINREQYQVWLTRRTANRP